MNNEADVAMALVGYLAVATVIQCVTCIICAFVLRSGFKRAPIT